MGVFFSPPSPQADVDAAESVLAASPVVGLVGYVDKAAAYQEFETLFRGTEGINTLAEEDMPPSLRVFLISNDFASLQAQLEGMPGVLKVSLSTVGERTSAPELNPIFGLYDIGKVVYERTAWHQSCLLQAWSLTHPEVV